MLRRTLATLIAGAALLGATAAQAGTHWSIGISVPGAVLVGESPRYYAEPAPVYYAPPPVYYAPAPRYVERDVYYAPAPRVVYETSYGGRGWDRHDDRRWEHERREHHERQDRREDRRDDYGPHRGR